MRREGTETGPIVIVGAGAIGGTLGAFLHDDGREVLLVDADREHVEAIRASGLSFAGVRGARNLSVPVAHTSEVEDSDVRFGTTFLCVKAHHTSGALGFVAPRLRDDGCVVSLQNGLNEDLIREAVGEERTVGAFVHFGADLVSPGEITLGYEETIRIGELDGSISPRVGALCEVLSDAMPSEPTTQIRSYLWGKLVFGAAGFAVSCVDAPVAEVLEEPVALEVAHAACSETYLAGRCETSVLKPIGTFDPEAFDPARDQLQSGVEELRKLGQVWRAQLKQHMGIWRDLKVKRKKTEAEAQLGAVLRSAEHHGIDAPTVRAVLEVTDEIERGERGMGWENLSEIAERGSGL